MNYDHAFISLGAKKLRKKRRVTLGSGGGDYTQKKVLSGEAQPHGLTPYPFIPPFLTERYPFVYLLLTNGTPLTYPPSLELCIPFNCCKYTVFEIWINHQTRTFSGLLPDFYTAINASVSPVFGAFLQTELTDFPILSSTSNSGISFHKPSAWNRHPFRAEPPGIGYYKAYPPGMLLNVCISFVLDTWHFIPPTAFNDNFSAFNF